MVGQALLPPQALLPLQALIPFTAVPPVNSIVTTLLLHFKYNKTTMPNVCPFLFSLGKDEDEIQIHNFKINMLLVMETLSLRQHMF